MEDRKDGQILPQRTLLATAVGPTKDDLCCLQEEINNNYVNERIKDAKKEQTVFKTKFRLCLEKLCHYSTRNVNERINRQKRHVARLKDVVASKEKKLSSWRQ